MVTIFDVGIGVLLIVVLGGFLFLLALIPIAYQQIRKGRSEAKLGQVTLRKPIPCCLSKTEPAKVRKLTHITTDEERRLLWMYFDNDYSFGVVFPLLKGNALTSLNMIPRNPLPPLRGDPCGTIWDILEQEPGVAAHFETIVKTSQADFRDIEDRLELAEVRDGSAHDKTKDELHKMSRHQDVQKELVAAAGGRGKSSQGGN